ncbi:MAG TPA: OPT family oligopeptide transporter [Kofleriaceae bacterium]|nr:OPT family oligopeptide transporter [Kofleriaceae bacterium]
MRAEGTGERELTARAIGFGLVLGGLLAAGNVYSGTKLAFIDSGMTMVVLMSFAVFAALRRPLSVLEANIAQVTGSSAAVMALTAGVVGPVPALAMGGHAPSSIWIAVWGAALGVFGTLIAAPFRRQLVEDDGLPFPSGRAAGELIKNLAAAGAGASRGPVTTLAVAFAAAALVVVFRDVFAAVPPDIALPLVIAGVPAASLGIGLGLSPLILGVGLLVGLRFAISMLVGGVVAWVVLAPALIGRGVIAGADYGSGLNWLVWPGVSMMVASSFTSLAFSGRSLWRAWSERHVERGAAWRWVRGGVVLCAAAIVAIGWVGFGVSPVIGLLALAISVVFSIVGLRATGETDQTPSGPLGALAQGLVGVTAPGSTLPPLFTGGVTNGAAGHSATMMQGWKTTHIVGGSPGRAMAAQLAGVMVGAVTAVLAYVLLDRAYGIGSQALPSPIAMSWKVTAEVVQGGISTMPAGAPLAALVGAAVGVLLAVLERGRAARLVPSAVALGVGFIVPVMTTAGIAIGALLFAALRRARPAWSEMHVPSLAAGLITGEALTGVVVAALVVAHVL